MRFLVEGGDHDGDRRIGGHRPSLLTTLRAVRPTICVGSQALVAQIAELVLQLLQGRRLAAGVRYFTGPNRSARSHEVTQR